MLLEAWRECESAWSDNNDGGNVGMVDKMMPRKMKMRRIVQYGNTNNDSEEEYEEYYEYQFPDDVKPVGKYIYICIYMHSLS